MSVGSLFSNSNTLFTYIWPTKIDPGEVKGLLLALFFPMSIAEEEEKRIVEEEEKRLKEVLKKKEAEELELKRKKEEGMFVDLFVCLNKETRRWKLLYLAQSFLESPAFNAAFLYLFISQYLFISLHLFILR